MNQPWYIHAMYTIIKPFLKDKTRKRVNTLFLSVFPLHLFFISSFLPASASRLLSLKLFHLSSPLLIINTLLFSLCFLFSCCCFFSSLFLPLFPLLSFSSPLFVPLLSLSPLLSTFLSSSHLLSSSPPQIFLHGNNLNSLHQLIQPECLPSEFGGTLPPYDMGIWARTLLGPDYNDETEYTLTYDALHVRENCGGGGGDKDMMKRCGGRVSLLFTFLDPRFTRYKFYVYL